MKSVPRLRAVVLAALASVSMPTLVLAQSMTVKDIAFESDNGLKVTIPSIEVTDSSLDEAAIRDLFKGGLEGASKTLATLTAASIVIPELTVTTPAVPGVEGSASTTTYHDFELKDVTDGVAGSMRLAGADMTAPEGITFKLGTMSASLANLGAFAGFYGVSGGGDDTMQPFYEKFSLDGMSLASPAFNCDVGAMTAESFRARPLKGTIDELMKHANALEAAEKGGTMPPPEALRAVVSYYIDILTAFESSPSTANGFSCQATEGNENFKLVGGPVTIGGFHPGIYPDLTLDGLRFEADDGWMEFSRFVWKKMDLNGPINAVNANLDSLTPAWFEANWRSLIPAIEGFSVEGLSLDVPGENASAQRVQATIGNADVTLGDYVNGIPTNIAMSATGINSPIPDPEAAAMLLAATGMSTLNVFYNVAANWDQASNTIAVTDLSFGGVKLGTIKVSGIIGNAGPQLFAADSNQMLAASTDLTLKEVTIAIENDGFLPALLAVGAAQERQPPEALQAGLAGLAQAMPISLLGATDDAKALGAALNAFLSGSPNLTVTISSIDPAGIGLPELMAAQNNPALLKDKVTIASSATGEPVAFVYPDLSAPPPAPTPDAAPAPADDTLEEAPTESPMVAPPAPTTRDAEKAGSKQ